MHDVHDVDELASAMAAAAEDTLPRKRHVEYACRFATVMWDRFSLTLLGAKERPHEQFVHLIHELEMDQLALKKADKLQVCPARINNPHNNQEEKCSKGRHSCQDQRTNHICSNNSQLSAFQPAFDLSICVNLLLRCMCCVALD